MDKLEVGERDVMDRDPAVAAGSRPELFYGAMMFSVNHLRQVPVFSARSLASITSVCFAH
jgi:hypothetical protein